MTRKIKERILDTMTSIFVGCETRKTKGENMEKEDRRDELIQLFVQGVFSFMDPKFQVK